jgi:hypothetical protein
MTDARFVSDAELIRLLGLPSDVGKVALRALDNRKNGRPFPQKSPLFGDRRYWPAVVAWLDCELWGMRVADPHDSAPEVRFVENLDVFAPKKAAGNRGARAELARQRKRVGGVLGRQDAGGQGGLRDQNPTSLGIPAGVIRLVSERPDD